MWFDGAESWTEDGEKCSLSVVSCVLSVHDTHPPPSRARCRDSVYDPCLLLSGDISLRTIQLSTGIDCIFHFRLIIYA